MARRKRGQGGGSGNAEPTNDNNQFDNRAHDVKIIVVELIVATVGCGLFATIDAVTASDWSWLRFWFWLSLTYILLTPRWWAPIQPDELAVRTRFGKPIDILSSGLPFIPPGIYGLVPFTTRTKNFEAPTEPEKIWREDTSPPEGSDMKPPIRVTFRSAITDEQARRIFGDHSKEYMQGEEWGDYSLKRPDGKVIVFSADCENDGLNQKRLTTEITPVVRWRIRDAIKYVKNIGSEEEVVRQIEDEMVSVLARICPQISASQAKANMEWLNELLRRAVERRVSGKEADRSDGWGIDIEGAYLKPISFNHSLNSEIADVVEAIYRKESTITDAEGERKKRELEGKGAGVAARELAHREREGKAKGYAAIAKATGLSGPEVVQLEAAEAVGKAPSNTIFAGETGVGSLAALAGAGFRATQKNPATPGEPVKPSDTATKDERSSE